MSNRRVIVTKHTQTLSLFDGDEEVMRIPVAVGKNPADKQREGDLATPEGKFFVCYRNAESRYHKFLGISYPNEEDAARGLREKLITQAEHDAICAAISAKKCPPWNTALGGQIGLHGPSPNGETTLGCIAMSVAAIEKLFSMLELGDEVEIRP
jgi:murein L,D-transpeptidase YafK